jgi:hypothetical protein
MPTFPHASQVTLPLVISASREDGPACSPSGVLRWAGRAVQQTGQRIMLSLVGGPLLPHPSGCFDQFAEPVQRGLLSGLDLPLQLTLDGEQCRTEEGL